MLWNKFQVVSCWRRYFPECFFGARALIAIIRVYTMEPNITNYDSESNRKSRSHWFLIALIVLLCVIIIMQGVALLTVRAGRHGQTPGRTWIERLQHFLPGSADQSRQASLGHDNQIVFWETTDDLEQIHEQINRLLRSMTPTFGAISGNPFAGIPLQRQGVNRSSAIFPHERDLNELQREIEQIFANAYNESQQNTMLSRFDHGWDMVSSSAAMNIEDHGSNYVINVALPGYAKQGIKINVEGHLLIIDANRATKKQAAATGTQSGQFHTQIMMPENIQSTGAQATYADNVLCIQIPKATETNSLVRTIEIR